MADEISVGGVSSSVQAAPASAATNKTRIDMTKAQKQGFGIRLGAYLLDGLILGIPYLIIYFGLAFALSVEFAQINKDPTMSMIENILSLCILVIIVIMDGLKGGSPGKLITGIRIVNAQGEYIGIPRAILRYIGKILSGAILGIGYLMIIWDTEKQGLEDKIASTYVVNMPK